MIRIREATPDDAENILAVYAPYVRDTAITFEYDVPSIEEFRQRIIHTLEHYPYLLAVNDHEILGYAYAGSFVGRRAYAHSSEVSIYVSREHHGKGIGRRLYEELEARLKSQGILNLYACIAYPEIEDEYLTRNSVKFHEHLGFKLVGHFHDCGYKFGRYYSMVWLEKIIGTHT